MFHFTRWLTFNGLLITFLLLGIITGSNLIYGAYTFMTIAIVFAMLSYIIPDFLLYTITAKPFAFQPFFDLLVDLGILALLILTCQFYWAVFYALVPITSQYIYSLHKDH